MLKKSFNYFNEKIEHLEKRSRILDRFYTGKSLGIYFGSHKIEIVRISKGYSSLTAFSSYSFLNPFTEIPSKDKKQEEKFLEELRSYLDKNDNDWDEVTIGLPRKEVILKQVTIPAPEKKLIPDILKYELEKHIPFGADKAWYDYQIISESENIYKLFLSAARKKVPEYYISLLEQVGVYPSIVDLSTCAIVNTLPHGFSEPEKIRQGSTLILVNHENNIELILLRTNEICISRHVCFSSGNGNSADSNFLISEIEKTVSNYPFFLKKDHELPSKIVINGFADALSIAKVIQEKTRVLALPLDLNLKIKGDKSKNIIALGLALRGLIKNPFAINLLPSSFKRRRRYFSGLVTIGLITLFFIFIPVTALSPYFKEVARLEIMEELLKEAKNRAKNVEHIYLEKDNLIKRNESFLKFKKGSVGKLKLLKELSTIIDSTTWLKSIDVDNKKIEIIGYAGSASMLINILEKSDMLKDVKFDGRIVKENTKELFKITAVWEEK